MVPTISSVDKTENPIWGFLFFILWPGIAFFYSIRNFGYKYSKSIIILFYGLFGFTQVVKSDFDSDRHQAEFHHIVNQPFSELFTKIFGIYSGKTGDPDFVVNIFAYTISRFTDNPKVYFFVLGIFLGWLVVKILNIQYDIIKDKKNFIVLLYFFFIIALIPPSRIVSIRHYLALLIFVYGLYGYFSEKKLKYLVIACLSIFTHFAFLMIIPLLGFYLYIGKNRNVFYYLLIVIAIAYHEQAASLIRTYGVEVDLGTEQAIKGYTHAGYLEKRQETLENSNSLIALYWVITTYFLMGSVILHKFVLKNFDSVTEKLYSFSLLLYSFVLFTQGLETASRFSILLQVIVCIIFIRIYTFNDIKISKWFKYASVLILLYNVVIIVRILMGFGSVLLITPFAPLSFFTEIEVPLIDLIK